MSFICMRMKNDFHIKGWAPIPLFWNRGLGELGNGLLQANAVSSVVLKCTWSVGDRKGLLLILACDLHCNSCWHFWADLCGSVVWANLSGFSSIGDEFNIGIMLNANILSTKQTCINAHHLSTCKKALLKSSATIKYSIEEVKWSVGSSSFSSESDNLCLVLA